jgi:glycosyltransferase involved in cell wall biosynthesis
VNNASELDMIRFCFLIPLYNHGGTLAEVISGMLSYDKPIIVVDDGSDENTKRIAKQLAQIYPQLTLLTLPRNQGKGAAVMAGLRYAHTQGWTHAIQIDADAQHDLGDIPKFIAAAKAEPLTFWSGCPIYDASVPKHRFYGRYITHVLVWLQTLSGEIRDSMCGYRAYPVAPAMAVIDRYRIPSRMVFETEFMVRFNWLGGRIRFIPTRVTYPEQGISHFKMWRDNRQLAWMHCRLICGMLFRMPILLWRRWRSVARAGESA